MFSSSVDEIKNRLDIVEVVGSYIKLQKAGANYRALCPFHSEKKPSFFLSPTRQIWHCFGGCLPAGSLIKTEKGYHNIEKVKIGQKVLTHKGRFMPILKTYQRPYESEIVDIKVRKSNSTISLTDNHKVYVIKTQNCRHKNRKTRLCQWHCQKHCPTKYFLDYKIEEIPAREISLNDYLLLPIDSKIVDVSSITLNDYLTRKLSDHDRRSKKLPEIVKVNEDFLKLLGYWIAEGSTDKYGHLMFSLGGHEKEFAQDIIRIIKTIFGFNATIRRKKNRPTSVDIMVNHSNLANIFENLCGKGAINKHIPFKFQNLPQNKQRIILEAIFRGDGNVGKVNKAITERYFKEIGTISSVLTEQLRDILLRLGIVPTIWATEPRIDRKGVSHRKSYTIHWQEDIKLHFADICEINNISYALFPVKEIKKRKFQGNVYNFTVDKDHSYVAENFVVSNCGEGGDIFKFVMKIEGVEFGDALRILAQKAGVELKRQTPEYREWQTERQRLYEICDLANRFFEKQLEESKTGKEAKKYLLDRGIAEESIKKWRLGYAPDVWQGLSDFLTSRGYQQEEIKKAGLGLSSEKGSFYDRFRARIIFPVFDLNSQVVGFGGRVFKDKDNKEIAKYVNTPQTILYDKGRILYGLDKAKVEIRKKDFCILVEGYIDLIMVFQAGFENVVATSGTALTPFQLKILKRYSDNLLTAFDMDAAGDAATKRGIDLAQLHGFNVKVVTLPQDLDPADLILKNQKEWEERIKTAKSIMDFYFESVFAKFDRETPDGKREIAKVLLPVIKRIPNRIVQSHWINELAKKLRVKEENVEEEFKKVKLGEYPEILGIEPAEIKNLGFKTRKEMLEERLVILVLKAPQNIGIIKEEELNGFLPQIKEILIKLKKNKKIESDFFNYLALKAEVEEIEEKEICPEIQCCLREILLIEIKNKLDQISQEIKKAEEERNSKKVEELIKEFNQLAKQKCQS